MTKATLELEGASSVVLEVVNHALNAGVVKSVVLGEAPVTTPPKRRSNGALIAGDRVLVDTARADYGVGRGDRGKVIGTKKAGRGKSVTIKWDDGTESNAPASILKRIGR